MMDPSDLALLRESEATGRLLHVVVTGCAYSCCGRPWIRRDGYEQHYQGYVNPLDDEEPITFTLVSPGIGTISYWCAIRGSELELVEPLEDAVVGVG